MRPLMPCAPLALALVAGASLTACGSDTPKQVVVTVTGTPSAAPSSADPAPSSTASTRVRAPTSDVEGRRFDFGQVTGAKRTGDVDVLVLDRWTDPSVDDTVVAKRGLPVASWQVGSDRYVNQNDKKTFDVPVREGTTFLLHHCVATGEPLQTRTVTATELAAAPDDDRLVLVTLDDDGWATGGETFAGC
jgi:hypothetical protein